VKSEVRARDVEMRYGAGPTQVRALRGVSLDVAGGEILVLMGPSGSGKTTLLSVLSGILTPTAGSVTLFDTEITQLGRAEMAGVRRKRLGFIFQGFNLFGALTARENVQLALALKGASAKAARIEADRLLDRVGIAHGAHRLPCDLSGGEKQRVSIARALAGAPSLVLADEPTASLDSESGHAVTALLRALAKEDGCTVIIVTHDARIADVADRVMHLADGKLAERA
jgi:putative ABC transport system ATP-binding protein